jgi:hypothetical protein
MAAPPKKDKGAAQDDNLGLSFLVSACLCRFGECFFCHFHERPFLSFRRAQRGEILSFIPMDIQILRIDPRKNSGVGSG